MKYYYMHCRKKENVKFRNFPDESDQNRMLYTRIAKRSKNQLELAGKTNVLTLTL